MPAAQLESELEIAKNVCAVAVEGIPNHSEELNQCKLTGP